VLLPYYSELELRKHLGVPEDFYAKNTHHDIQPFKFSYTEPDWM